MTTRRVRTKKQMRENPNIRTFNFDWPTNDKVTTRLRDILEPEVKDKYYLPKNKTAKLMTELESQDSDNVEVIGHIEGIRGHDICKRLYSTAGVSPTLLTGTSGNSTPKIVIIERVGPTGLRIHIRKLTPRECWRLQGFSDKQFDKAKAARVSDTQLYKQAGNAVTVNVIAEIANKINQLCDTERGCNQAADHDHPGAR